MVNPKVIVEVASPATVEYDRGEKLQHYFRIASLEAVVLVQHDRCRVEVWTRGGDQWQSEVFETGTVPLSMIGCTLQVEAIYAAAREA